MSAPHRSIKQRLAKAKAPSLKRTIAHDWAKNWEDDQMDIVRQLRQGLRHEDMRTIAAAVMQLAAVTEKRFAALSGVIDAISQPGIEK